MALEYGRIGQLRSSIAHIVLLSYCAILMGLCVQLIRIHRNPERFDRIPGYKRYQQSKYFWPPHFSYRKFEVPDRVLATPMWLIAVLPFLWIEFVKFFHGLGSTYECYTFQFSGMAISYFGVIATFVSTFVLSSYLALYSKLPMDICYTLFHMGQGVKRHEVWKKWTIYLLVAVMVMCPLQLAAMVNGGYINELELVYYTGLSSEEKVFVFSQIDEPQIVVDETTGEVTNYIITNDKGEQVDLCNRRIVFDEISDFDLWRYVDERLS